MVWYAMKTMDSTGGTLKVVLNVDNYDCFCRIRSQFAYIYHYVLFFCPCVFLLQFSLFWSFFTLVWFILRKTKKVAILKRTVNPGW